MYLKHALSLLPDAALVLDVGGVTVINRSIFQNPGVMNSLITTLAN